MNLSTPARSMPWPNGRVADTILREMEAHRKRLGAQLLDLRKARGWNQEDAAHEVGVGVKTWRLWERGKTMPYDSNIRKIAEVFEIEPDDLGQQKPAPLGMRQAEPGEIEALLSDDSVLVDRLGRIEDAIAALRAERQATAHDVQALLEIQSGILDDIRDSIETERQARADADQARRDAQEATRMLLGALEASRAQAVAARQQEETQQHRRS